MQHQTGPEHELDQAISRAATPRGAAILIASTATTITVIAGLSMRVLDPSGFPTLGSGLWWAVQTVTTVGYGDKVPTTTAGRLVAAVVMLVGIAFVTVITASITGAFVAQSRGSEVGTSAERLRAIDERLERIEAALERIS